MTATPPFGDSDDPTLDAALSPAPPSSAGEARRGGGLYFFASVSAQASALVRYVILARLLGPEQLGLAATLVVTAAFFDLISDLGADRFLIQDSQGDSPSVQNLVQLAYVGRGLLIAASLILAAVPVSHFFRAPQLARGLAFLALSPAILGFLHLDIRRVQRRHDFRPEATSLIAAEGASLIVTSLAAWLTRDFTAILYGLITRALVMVLVSHIRAERPYALGWAREHVARLAGFSSPLMLNGLMLYLGSQGDRALVGRQLGVGALGRYSAVLLLIYYPSAMLVRYMHAIYMPLAASGRDDPVRRHQVRETLAGQTTLLAMAMSAGFAVVTPPIVTILYGAKFTETALIVGLIGILQSTRFLINWPATISLSMGRSRTVLAGSVVRLLVFPGALIGYRLFGGLTGVVGGFAAGEMIAVIIAVALVNRDTGDEPLRGFGRFAMFIATSGLIKELLSRTHFARPTRGAEGCAAPR